MTDDFAAFSSMTLLPSHPYAANFEARIVPLPGDAWAVKWRDFDGVKQDADFPTFFQAQSFHANLTASSKRGMRVESYYPNGLGKADCFWKSLYRPESPGGQN